MTVEVIHGDCLDVLAGMRDNTVDAIVTDPPYEISFMGKGWDGSGIAYNVELWRECLRVLKPGGHLLAFGGTRTYHRMTCAIEDAGFEIRDSLHWLYGSGFPKSLDVSKTIDKAAGAQREVVGTSRGVAVAPSDNQYGGINRGAVGVKQVGVDLPITAPATDAAKQWEGWGTALKPAHEPIVVARKPLIGTVAATVLTHGTGALNIDGCRVGTTETLGRAKGGWGNAAVGATNYGNFNSVGVTKEGGRWPANLVLTHAVNCADTCADGCPVAELDRQSGVGVSRAGGVAGWQDEYVGGTYTPIPHTGHNDSGGASRFFTVTEWDPTADVAPFRYVAKPSKRERNAGLEDGNHHPTVKPVALMRWLVRLVTPPGGTVLDPFAGSGTTLVAATLEGFDAIGIEMTDDYLQIIAGRVAWAEAQPDKVTQTDPTLFDVEPDR